MDFESPRTVFPLPQAFKPKLAVWTLRLLSQVLEMDRGDARHPCSPHPCLLLLYLHSCPAGCTVRLLIGVSQPNRALQPWILALL